MSRESAIEAIESRLKWAIHYALNQGWSPKDTEQYTQYIIATLAEHGFVHLDDVADSMMWKLKVHGELGDNDDEEIWYMRPATIREVLSGLALRKEA